MPPHWLIQLAVAGVWLWEGLFNKLILASDHQLDVVSAAPYGQQIGRHFLKVLGVVETAIAVWVLTGYKPGLAALVQTCVLVGLNTAGVTFARHLIHDVGGMLAKNFALLVLAWVNAGLVRTVS